MPLFARIKTWLTWPSIQIVLCLLVFAGVGYRLGPFGIVVTSPLLAAAIARPVLTLLANLRHRAREHTWLPVHGQHYVYKGVTVNVLEDDDHCRWVSLVDVRKVVGLTASERALAVAYPGRFQQAGRGSPCLRDDALIEHLGKENNPAALRMRTWVERNVAFPGRRLRASRGIRVEPPDADA